MAKLGPGHMPYTGASAIDPPGLELTHDWIMQLPARKDDELLVDRLAGLNQTDLANQNRPKLAERARLIDQLLADSGRAARLSHALHQKRFPESTREGIGEADLPYSDAAGL